MPGWIHSKHGAVRWYEGNSGSMGDVLQDALTGWIYDSEELGS